MASYYPTLSHTEAKAWADKYDGAVDKDGDPLKIVTTKVPKTGELLIHLQDKNDRLLETHQLLPRTTKEKVTGVASDVWGDVKSVGTSFARVGRDIQTGILGSPAEAFMGLGRVIHEGTGKLGDVVEDYKREQAVASGDFSQYETPVQKQEREEQRELERRQFQEQHLQPSLGFQGASDLYTSLGMPPIERDVSTPLRRFQNNLADEIMLLLPYSAALSLTGRTAGAAQKYATTTAAGHALSKEVKKPLLEWMTPARRELFENPARFAATESAIAAGGAGGMTTYQSLAGELYGDPYMNMLANLTGSLTVGGSIGGVQSLKSQRSRFTSEGRESIASEVIKDNTHDINAALRSLDEDNPLDADILSGSLSDDVGLQTMEKALTARGKTLPDRWKSFQRAFSDLMNREVGKVTGDGSLKGDWFNLRTKVNKLNTYINKRIGESVNKAEESYANDLKHTPDDAATQARAGIDDVEVEVKKIKDDAYNKIPNEPVSSEIVEEQIAKIGNDLTEAEKNVVRKYNDDGEIISEQVTGVIPQHLEKYKRIINNILEENNGVIDVSQLRGLQVMVNEDITKAYNAGDLMLGRRLGEIKNSIRKQFDESAQTGKPELKEAVAYSNLYYEYFDEGTIAKILKGTNRRKGLPERETLNSLFTANGATAADDILRIIDDPNSPLYDKTKTLGVNTETAKNVLDNIDNYILARLANDVKTSKSNKKHRVVENFINQNKDMLDRFPIARGRIQAIADDLYDAEMTLKIMKNNKTRLNETAAAKFLNTRNLDEHVESIFNSDPAAIDSLIKTAKKDMSGKAIKGIKTSLYNKIINKRLDDLRSGQKFHTLLRDRKKQLISIYGEDGYKALKEIDDAHKTFWSAETGHRGSQTTTAQIAEERTQASILTRLVGAKFGRSLPLIGGTLQAPAYWASTLGTKFERIGIDDINRIIEQAFTDKELMKRLLKKPTAKNLTEFQKQWKASPWLRGVIQTQEDTKPKTITLEKIPSHGEDIPNLPIGDEEEHVQEYINIGNLAVPIEQYQGTQTTN